MNLPKHLLPTTVVGSYPQPGWLVDRPLLSGSELRTALVASESVREREALYRRIELALLDDLPMIPIAWGDYARPRDLYVLGAAVHGLIDPVTGYQTGDYGRAWLAR